MMIRLGLALALGLAVAGALGPLSETAAAETAKVVLIAGKPSHGPGEHEFNAGILLIEKCLKEAAPAITPVVVKGGWPADESVFNGARAVVFFMDGGERHPIVQGDHLATLQKLMDKGVGIACLHYAVEIPKGKPGDRFLDWLGGYYETGYSANPHWTADFKSIPEHPITRGVKPFAINDEWYFGIRFRPEMKGVTSLLIAKPSDATRRSRPLANILADKGKEEVVSWCVERPDGGRGFGFTGAHTHANWGDPNFRTFVLNAILWTAKVDVPSEGVQCAVSTDDLKQDLDPKRAK